MDEAQDGPWRHMFETDPWDAAQVTPSPAPAPDLEAYFPVRRHPEHGAEAFGPEVLRYPEAFASWAKNHLADSALLDFVSSDGAQKEFFQSVGHLREYGNIKGHADTCEFWMPIGWIDSIVRKHTGTQFVGDRSFLLSQLLRTMRVTNGMLQEEYAFQVLCIELEGQPRYFWRANQAHGRFLYWQTPEAQANRRQKRSDWYHRSQAQAALQAPRDARQPYGSGRWQHGNRVPPPPPAPPRADSQQWQPRNTATAQAPDDAWAGMRHYNRW